MTSVTQQNLFDDLAEFDFTEEVEVLAICWVCERGYHAMERPPILSREQRIENGYKEIGHGVWLKLLDACSRECEQVIEKLKKKQSTTNRTGE